MSIPHFLIHSSIDRQLVCFYLLAIVVLIFHLHIFFGEVFKLFRLHILLIKNFKRFLLATPWACGILVPQTEIEPVPPAGEAQSPNHWTAEEFPILLILKFGLFVFLFLSNESYFCIIDTFLCRICN